MKPLLIAAALLGPPALAATLADWSVSERARAADRVLLAKVGESRVELPEGDPARMMTFTRLEVLAEYKGKGPLKLELVQIGGKYGLWERKVPGDAVLRAGERAVLFLRCREDGGVQRCTLVGLARGKLELVGGKAGPKAEVKVLSAAGEQQRPLSQIVAEVRASAPGGRGGNAENNAQKKVNP